MSRRRSKEKKWPSQQNTTDIIKLFNLLRRQDSYAVYVNNVCLAKIVKHSTTTTDNKVLDI